MIIYIYNINMQRTWNDFHAEVSAVLRNTKETWHNNNTE